MSRGTAYYDLPNGERIELPTTMPDVEEVPGPLCDGKFELPEAVKEMFKWIKEKQIWYNEAAIQTELENAEVGRLVRCWLKNVWPLPQLRSLQSRLSHLR